MSEVISFRFDGRDLSAKPGSSLAAALTEAGIRELRDGPHGSRRGMFCGMGVCQDCLVEVNGKPNRRACMTKVEPGMDVRTQVARPQLNARSEESGDPIIENPDVLIVGGGAGGLSAAVAAAEAGADVLLLDERGVSGGQFYKQRADDKPPLDRQQSDGFALACAAQASGARILDRTEVWGAFDGPVIYAKRDDQPVVVRPKSVIIASGAYERPRFVRGWDLPGVMTTGAAQTLWRSYGVLAGQRVAVLGNGPLNLQVADELRAGGAKVVVVAEAASAPWSRIALASAMMTSSPGLTLAGLATTLRLMRHGVPVRYQSVVSSIEAKSNGLEFELKSAKATSRWTADAVCLNYGFHPQNELLRLLGATFQYDTSRKQLICQRADTCETTKRGIFGVGDCCGMGGAPAAREEGLVAGRAAALRARGE
nr:2Fe-2S iron-sulfur cluster-binding protein [Paracoccaceae bacterium]